MKAKITILKGTYVGPFVSKHGMHKHFLAIPGQHERGNLCSECPLMDKDGYDIWENRCQAECGISPGWLCTFALNHKDRGQPIHHCHTGGKCVCAWID